MSEYLAQPPSLCCTRGSVHEGTPAGTETTVAGLRTYVARPPAGVTPNGHIVFYLSDIWGLSNNAKLLMDAYAAAGYVTLGPDFFEEDPLSNYRSSPAAPMPAGFDQAAWRDKHFAAAQEHMPRWVAAAKAAFGSGGGGSSSGGPGVRYACVGYCFGAPFVLDLLAADDGAGVAVGAVAHPSQLKAHHFRACTRPLFLSCAVDDHQFPTEPRRQAVDLLRAGSVPFHEQLFQNVQHGFASRGNLRDPYERWAKEQSLQGILSWFDLWLVRNPPQ